ncbi:DUF4864 domain-containing protein [Acuticoccus kandeliae]|uniref:DUF4864 domain-containing protein n=1 Tax=Acuticoccus kandeliae TaxID=2073160 RepID=UPI000D3EA646|nr:DUF4864 domain-containing protein [Acuticoccus kandeliae]
MKSVFVPAVFAAFVAFATPVEADPLDVRETIEAQLEAFRTGNADAAYALAGPKLQRMFPTPERFIRMVRRGYGPVYHAQSVVYLRSKAMEGDGFAQEVGFTDNTGKSWTALYTLAKQPNGEWRITGCYLRKADDQAA